jgi:hypothetical protein
VVQPLLGLDDESARRHLWSIKDLSTGLVSGIGVDRASMATIVALRQRHRPTPELDVVLESLATFVDHEILV